MPNFSGFDKMAVKMPGKSGFDMSHSNFFSAFCGTLTPCLMDWLNPGDKVHVSCDNLQVQLPPMASDFYGFVEAKVECFFVPNRVLYGGWQVVIAPYLTSESQDLPEYSSLGLPQLSCSNGNVEVGSYYELLEYLGNRVFTIKRVVESSSVRSSDGNFDIFPVLAYHKICDDWYKDLRVQRPAFIHPNFSASGNYQCYHLPWMSIYQTSFSPNELLYDGVELGCLRQRLWSKDIFTNATFEPQLGDASSVTVEDGTFTIASLRSANALQQYLERNNIAGNSYQDRIKAHFGVYPSDSVVDRSIYLGRMSVPVYTKGVFQTGYVTGGSQSQNPFQSVATKYGSSQAVGRGELCDNFEVTEHGVLMCLFSLVPRRSYSSGTRRQWLNTDYSDYPDPILASLGDEPIFDWQLCDPSVYGVRNTYNENSSTFGYTQRYSSYKYMNDEVHGLLADPFNLSPFALQDSFTFDNSPKLGTEFLEIPRDYLDQVTAVSSDASKFGCWVDSHWDYKKVSTLPAYSIPSLENLPLDGHYDVINSGGFRL